MDQKKTVRPFSMKDKIGYTLGDLGCCFTEQYRAMYLSIFYTLILQVNPFHVGILLLVTKIWDAVNDPIIGAIVDSRKATKGGKFIPWIRALEKGQRNLGVDHLGRLSDAMGVSSDFLLKGCSENSTLVCKMLDDLKKKLQPPKQIAEK